MPKFKVLEGAAPEMYGSDIRPGDVLTLTQAQADHLLAKGHIEAVPEVVEPASAKGPAGGRRD